MKDTEKFTGAKYIIKANFTVDGVVEKHDVIGAIFGQTEGLFPKELELRELLKSGKIGRIDLQLKSSKGNTSGTITIPSSIDRAETALIAAAIETVDRVGPCDATIKVESITDVRVEKRQQILRRAKELMRSWVVKEGQEIESLLEEVQKVDRQIKAVKYGRDRLTASPDISSSKEIIVVEGRADVNNLLKSGVTGVIAMEGVRVPKTIKDLSSKKEVTAFLDGDRGGDMILHELMQVAPPKYVARAPAGKEVEELTPDEIKEALEKRVPLESLTAGAQPPAKERPPRAERPKPPRAPPKPKVPEKFAETAKELRGTLEAVLFSGEEEVSRVPVSELVETLKDSEGVEAVVFDGIVTGRLIDTAKEKGVKNLIGERVAEGVRIPRGLNILSFKDLS